MVFSVTQFNDALRRSIQFVVHLSGTEFRRNSRVQPTNVADARKRFEEVDNKKTVKGMIKGFQSKGSRVAIHLRIDDQEHNTSAQM